MDGQGAETIKDTEREKKEWARRQLLEAAVQGEGINTPLMIGSVPVENGLTFEAVRDELYRLIQEGLVVLDSSWKPQLTEAGLRKLSGL